jgi:hypothetical protein
MFITVLPYIMGVQSKEDEKYRACGTYEGEQKYKRGFWGKPKGKNPFGRPRL